MTLFAVVSRFRAPNERFYLPTGRTESQTAKNASQKDGTKKAATLDEQPERCYNQSIAAGF